MDRLSFLVLGLLLGATLGAGVAWRLNAERAADADALRAAKAEVTALRAERDRLAVRLDVATARMERAEGAASALREQVEATPAAEAARARREAARTSQKAELLRLLGGEAGVAGGAAEVAGGGAR